jgi:hypothetical protein
MEWTVKKTRRCVSNRKLIKKSGEFDMFFLPIFKKNRNKILHYENNQIQKKISPYFLYMYS